MPKTIAQALCWSAIAFSLVWLIAGQNGGIVFQNPLATIGVALIGMGLIKHFAPNQSPKPQAIPVPVPAPRNERNKQPSDSHPSNLD